MMVVHSVAKMARQWVDKTDTSSVVKKVESKVCLRVVQMVERSAEYWDISMDKQLVVQMVDTSDNH